MTIHQLKPERRPNVYYLMGIPLEQMRQTDRRTDVQKQYAEICRNARNFQFPLPLFSPRSPCASLSLSPFHSRPPPNSPLPSGLVRSQSCLSFQPFSPPVLQSSHACFCGMELDTYIYMYLCLFIPPHVPDGSCCAWPMVTLRPDSRPHWQHNISHHLVTSLLRTYILHIPYSVFRLGFPDGLVHWPVRTETSSARRSLRSILYPVRMIS